MAIIQLKKVKAKRKLAELSSSNTKEYTLNPATIKSLGLVDFYPSEVLFMLLMSCAYSYFKDTRYPVSLERFLTLYENSLTTRNIDAVKYWYFDHELIAKTTCDSDLINTVKFIYR